MNKTSIAQSVGKQLLRDSVIGEVPSLGIFRGQFSSIHLTYKGMPFEARILLYPIEMLVHVPRDSQSEKLKIAYMSIKGYGCQNDYISNHK